LDAISLCPGKAVYILWEDSATIDGWRRNPSVDIGEITTVGLVVEHDKRGVVVTTSLNDEFSCICPLSIPWSCITKLIELEPEWNKEYKGHDCTMKINSLFNIKPEDRELTEKYEKICQELETRGQSI